ncbi:N-acetylmuramoyl-L-alanine amidase [Zavarzinia compransoris]|uniref:N-acetylmuramoyl-L-alanine amidase n=1 Tax=Zavarzinia compransoris TaxID=1264899 RepID=A0A317EB02_9PROT|nr:N-acetylmuramoyl-L-alanine amidase [Zavarzinia compransoris]
MDRRDILRFGLGLPFLLSAGAAEALAESLPTPARKPAPPRGAAAGPVKTMPVIMLDPGHGGRDPGAIGPSGAFEKDITLDLAKRIATRIESRGRCKVILTRRKDVFVPLKDRAFLAQTAKADFFVSIHADSAPNPDARGLSAYTLSEKASDGLAAAIADRENAVDLVHGLDVGVSDPDVAAILFDLTRRHSLNTALARKAHIVKAAGAKLRLMDNPRRSANFAVLKVPDVPAVLIETGFLSNAADERLLTSEKSRAQIAQVLADAFTGAVTVA